MAPGPLLFLLCVDEICHLELSAGSKILVYADDVLLYKPIYSDSDTRDLQKDVDLIFNWAKTITLP